MTPPSVEGKTELVRSGLLLSDLLRFHIWDEHGRSAPIRDISIDPTVGEFPVVTCVVYRLDGAQRSQLWRNIRPFWRYKRFGVDDLTGTALEDDALNQAVLLKRDVLDGLLVDIEHLQVTRANDLWLHQLNDQLYLGAADTSPWAVIRRLAGGLLGHGSGERLLDWKHVEFLRGDPEVARLAGDYHGRLADIEPGSVARLAEAMPYLEAAEMLSLIPAERAAPALEALAPTVQLQVFEEFPVDRGARVLGLMAPEAAADLLGLLEPEDAQNYLNRLPPHDAEPIIELLRYPPDTAGGIMTNQLLTMKAALCAADARETLREQLRRARFFQRVHVVDAAGCLHGTLSIRRLLLAEDTERLGDIMTPKPARAAPLEPATEVAARIVDGQLPGLPVVATDGRLLGAVTLDAAVSLVAPAAWREQAPRIFS